LLDPVAPNLLLDTDFISANEGEITKINPSTSYTIVVHGYTAEGKSIGKTLPLHAKTSSAPLQMSIVREPIFTSNTTMEIAFSLPVALDTVDIITKNTKTKKILTLQNKAHGKEDMRVVILTFQEPIELALPYEITLKNIIALNGSELPPENRIPIKVVYHGELPPWFDTPIPAPWIETPSIPVAIIPDTIIEDEKFEAPVPIDSLPKTGPDYLIWMVLLSAGMYFVQKKYRHFSR
jgi:hypothetical protein